MWKVLSSLTYCQLLLELGMLNILQEDLAVARKGPKVPMALSERGGVRTQFQSHSACLKFSLKFYFEKLPITFCLISVQYLNKIKFHLKSILVVKCLVDFMESLTLLPFQDKSPAWSWVFCLLVYCLGLLICFGEEGLSGEGGIVYVVVGCQCCKCHSCFGRKAFSKRKVSQHFLKMIKPDSLN